jgi:hypothetical protein
VPCSASCGAHSCRSRPGYPCVIRWSSCRTELSDPSPICRLCSDSPSQTCREALDCGGLTPLSIHRRIQDAVTNRNQLVQFNQIIPLQYCKSIAYHELERKPQLHSLFLPFRLAPFSQSRSFRNFLSRFNQRLFITVSLACSPSKLPPSATSFPPRNAPFRPPPAPAETPVPPPSRRSPEPAVARISSLGRFSASFPLLPRPASPPNPPLPASASSARSPARSTAASAPDYTADLHPG